MSLKDDIERGHAIANHVYGSHELGATTRHLAIQDANAVENLAVACEQLAAELKTAREVLRSANIEILPDGSHQFKPRAIKYYCGEITAERLAKAEDELKQLRELPKRYEAMFASVSRIGGDEFDLTKDYPTKKWWFDGRERFDTALEAFEAWMRAEGG